jgi:hypothetical protein
MFTEDVLKLKFCVESGSKEFPNFVRLLWSPYQLLSFTLILTQSRRISEGFISYHTSLSPSVFWSQYNSNFTSNVAIVAQCLNQLRHQQRAPVQIIKVI